VTASAGRSLHLSRSALLLAILCGFLAAGSTAAQETRQAGQPVRVGLYLSPPFVMQEQSRVSGMAIELWESLARSQGIESEYRTFPTVRALIDATANGDIDVAVTNLTITQGRAQRIDFTHPWFDAGLRIMVDHGRGTGFSEVVIGLRDAGYLRAYAWLARSSRRQQYC
jgi:polar amino acid transport system substrate-binding protein